MYLNVEMSQIIQKMRELYDNPISILTNKSGLSRPTVSKFFNENQIKPSNTAKLYHLCLECVKEKEEIRSKTFQKQNALISRTKNSQVAVI